MSRVSIRERAIDCYRIGVAGSLLRLQFADVPVHARTIATMSRHLKNASGDFAMNRDERNAGHCVAGNHD